MMHTYDVHVNAYKTAGSFSPHVFASPARARGCYTCAHFRGRFLTEHLVCEHRGGVQVIGTPKMRCAFWEREPGANHD